MVKIDFNPKKSLTEREILKEYSKFFKDPIVEFYYVPEERWWEINGIIRAIVEEILQEEPGEYTIVIKFEVVGFGMIEESENE